MNHLLRSCVAGFILAGGSIGIAAAADGESACEASPPFVTVEDVTDPGGFFDFFLGITPSDSPLDLWCRLQRLNGEFELTLRFPVAQVERSVAVTFDGTPSRGKGQFAAHLQSFFRLSGETRDLPPDYAKIASNVVQAAAAMTADERVIALPTQVEAAERLALWEPMNVRVRSLQLYGAPFDLEVRFVPSVGRFLASIDGVMENMTLRAWRQDVVRTHEAGEGGCFVYIPLCNDMPAVLDLNMAWRIDSVVLRARGERLSAPAQSFFAALIAQAPRPDMSYDMMRNFVPTIGEGEVEVASGPRAVRGVATGEQDGRGTKEIVVTWAERPNNADSFISRIDKFGQDYRNEAILASFGLTDSKPGEATDQTSIPEKSDDRASAMASEGDGRSSAEVAPR